MTKCRAWPSLSDFGGKGAFKRLKREHYYYTQASDSMEQTRVEWYY